MEPYFSYIRTKTSKQTGLKFGDFENVLKLLLSYGFINTLEFFLLLSMDVVEFRWVYIEWSLLITCDRLLFIISFKFHFFSCKFLSTLSKYFVCQNIKYVNVFRIYHATYILNNFLFDSMYGYIFFSLLLFKITMIDYELL